MTIFPSIEPTGRTYTPGEYPHTPFDSYSGWQNRVRHSNVMLASQVRLSYVALTEADMLSILSHYNGQYGTFESFSLSTATWSGAIAGDYQLSNYQWRYAEPPTVEDVYCDRYNVELTLETVPAFGGIVSGAIYIATVDFLPGSAAVANGLSRTITITFAPTGYVLPGFDGTVATSFGAANGIVASVAASLAAGTPDVVIGSDGFTESITLSLAAGTATGGGAAADDDAGFAAHLYWAQDLYIDWR